MSLPENYEKYMKDLLKEDFDSYENSLSLDRALGIRANTLKINPLELPDVLNQHLDPVLWCKEGFYYSEDFRPGKSPYYNAGLFYIQEPSAMISAALIPIEENDRVLDLCAAPGGKSTYLGARLRGSGLLVSNDISPGRTRALLKNIELFGIKNASVLSESPDKLAAKFPGFFDKILIDAPCSGEGMFRKDEGAVKSYIENGPENYLPIQKSLLQRAAEMLKPGGIIAYSTCTFNTLENELMIKNFLDSHSEFSLINIDHEAYGIAEGFDIKTDFFESLSGCGRIWPHKQRGEGHFIALLRHKGEKKENTKEDIRKNKIKNIEYFYDFCGKNLNEIPEGNLILHEASLMILPNGITDLKGIRTVRSGFYLGDLKDKRFEPSHALAMALNKDDFKNTLSFTKNDENLYRYLKGESLDIDAPDGYVLICLDKWPIGFGKTLNGRIKNKYPKGLIY